MAKAMERQPDLYRANKTSALRLELATSARGAAMGRPDELPADPSASIDLLLTRLDWEDGDYDLGGAYWGGGFCEEVWIYAAWTNTPERIRVYVRAHDYQEACQKVQKILPRAYLIDESLPPTKVLFRLWKHPGDSPSLIALFPEEAEDNNPENCACYQFIGQHGGANLFMIIRESRPATEEEYRKLKRELETRYDYRLQVLQRTPNNAYAKRRAQISAFYQGE